MSRSDPDNERDVYHRRVSDAPPASAELTLLPKDFKVVRDRDFATRARTMEDNAGAQGFYSAEAEYMAGWDIVNDPAAPKSGPKVAEFRFPQVGARLPHKTPDDASYSPGWAACNFTPAAVGMYTALWVKYSKNFQGHPVRMLKQQQWVLDNRNFIVPMVVGGGMEPLVQQLLIDCADERSDYYTGVTSQGCILPNWNARAATLWRDRWNLVETLVYPNKSEGCPEWDRHNEWERRIVSRRRAPRFYSGVVRQAVNGILTMAHDDWLVRGGSSQPWHAGPHSQFGEWKLDQVHGGAGSHFTDRQYSWVDHVIIAVK